MGCWPGIYHKLILMEMEPNIDFDSPTWRALRGYCENELAICRIKNDAMLSEEETAKVRGVISFIKKVLGLETAPAKPNDDAFGRPQIESFLHDD